MWRNRIFGVEVPIETDAATKGCSFSDRVTLRVRRAMRGISGTVIAMIDGAEAAAEERDERDREQHAGDRHHARPSRA